MSPTKTTISRVLSKLEEQLSNEPSFDDGDIMGDERYTRKLSALITDSLQRGYDVMQLANGDMVITEVKTVTYQYGWDRKKGRFERTKSGSRVKRKSRREANQNDSFTPRQPATAKTSTRGRKPMAAKKRELELA